MKAILPCKPIVEAEIDLGAFAGWLARQTDEIQATFFNEFDTQLRRACDIKENPGSMGHVMQILNITKYLSVDAKYTLLEMGRE